MNSTKTRLPYMVNVYTGDNWMFYKETAILVLEFTQENACRFRFWTRNDANLKQVLRVFYSCPSIDRFNI